MVLHVGVGLCVEEPTPLLPDEGYNYYDYRLCLLFEAILRLHKFTMIELTTTPYCGILYPSTFVSFSDEEKGLVTY